MPWSSCSLVGLVSNGFSSEGSLRFCCAPRVAGLYRWLLRRGIAGPELPPSQQWTRRVRTWRLRVLGHRRCLAGRRAWVCCVNACLCGCVCPCAALLSHGEVSVYFRMFSLVVVLAGPWVWGARRLRGLSPNLVEWTCSDPDHAVVRFFCF